MCHKDIIEAIVHRNPLGQDVTKIDLFPPNITRKCFMPKLNGYYWMKFVFEFIFVSL